MTIRALLLALAVSLTAACSGTWGGARTANHATFAVAAAATALDWCQTRTAADRRWMSETKGPVQEIGFARYAIGASPSRDAVDVYFLAAAAAGIGLAQFIPQRWRWAAYGAIAAVEVKTTHDNLDWMTCGGVGTR